MLHAILEALELVVSKTLCAYFGDSAAVVLSDIMNGRRATPWFASIHGKMDSLRLRC